MALFESILAEQVCVHNELHWEEREGVLRAVRQPRGGELAPCTLQVPFGSSVRLD